MDAREDFTPAIEYQKQDKIEQNTQQSLHNNTYTTTQTEAEPDYTGFFLQANKDIEKTSYHRGLTLETLNLPLQAGICGELEAPKSPSSSSFSPSYYSYK